MITMEQAINVKKLIEASYPMYQKVDDKAFYFLVRNYEYQKLVNVVVELCKTSVYPITMNQIDEEYKNALIDPKLLLAMQAEEAEFQRKADEMVAKKIAEIEDEVNKYNKGEEK
jgi:predicted polyphosphate/ATP-dependent NAD kinase